MGLMGVRTAAKKGAVGLALWFLRIPPLLFLSPEMVVSVAVVVAVVVAEVVAEVVAVVVLVAVDPVPPRTTTMTFSEVGLVGAEASLRGSSFGT